jgi:hypothetical protein
LSRRRRRSAVLKTILTRHQRAVRRLAAHVAQREQHAVLGRQRLARVRQLALERAHHIVPDVDQCRRDHR